MRVHWRRELATRPRVSQDWMTSNIGAGPALWQNGTMARQAHL
jgi:hypothetical protein